MPIFKARFRGTCAKCGGRVEPGVLVSWSRRQRGVVYHASCAAPDDTQRDEARPEPRPQPPEASQAQPERETPQASIPESDIEAIARRVARGEDMGVQARCIAEIDRRISEAVTRSLIVTHNGNGKPSHDVKVDNAHQTLSPLVYLINKGEHVYLYGPPGSGKSTGAIMAAKALERPFGYISLNPQTPESRLLGHATAGGGYVEPLFIKLYETGGVFVIDELDNAHPALLNTLNAALETDDEGVGRLGLPHRIVVRHPDFVCVGTGNTNGRGADKLFPERRALDSAFLERFTFLHWGYDLALECALTLARNPNAGPWLDWVRDVRGYVTKRGIRLWASPRASVKGAALLSDSDWTIDDIASAVLFKGLDADTVAHILQECPLPSDYDMRYKAQANA